jgi:lysozyme
MASANWLSSLGPTKGGKDGLAMGCDISAWQDDYTTPKVVDFKQMKAAGMSFVYLKSSQSTWMDRTFIDHRDAAEEADLMWGAYHFLSWDDPIKQADYFSMLLANNSGDLPPICDFEWWKTTPSNAVGMLAQFIQRVKTNLERQPGIYTAPGYWTPNGSVNPFFADCPLWIAHWRVKTPIVPKPWTDWEFWQDTDKGDGRYYGVESKQIDIDYFNGTVEELKAKYATHTAPTLPTYTDEEKLDMLWDEHPELHR